MRWSYHGTKAGSSWVIFFFFSYSFLHLFKNLFCFRLNSIDTTLIEDQAVFALMARVNKVVLSAAAVLADGGVVARSGLFGCFFVEKKHIIE